MHWSDRLVNQVLIPRLRKPDEGPLSSAERLRKHAEQRAIKPASYAPPGWALRGCTVSAARREQMPVYTVQATTKPATEIVFLHGGAYVNEILVFHWLLIGHLARATGARVVVPIYPLAPLAEAADVVPAVARLVGETDVLIGDSAGGGLALATIHAGARPRRQILISPWLDVTCSDPEQPVIERRDHILRIAGLRAVGQLWAGRLDTADPLVSPLFGSFDQLPPTTVFAGRDDLLFPDATRLAQRANIELIAVPDAQHDFPLFLGRIAKDARRELVARCV